MAELKKGDRVTWKSHGGTAEGTVVEKRSKDFTLAGQRFRASADEPKYVVESDNGGRAAHNPSALKRA